jgi:hypothetical protein
VKTKKEAKRVMKVWMSWYERCGWTVENRPKGDAAVAYPPGYVNDGVIAHQIGDVHAICLRDSLSK